MQTFSGGFGKILQTSEGLYLKNSLWKLNKYIKIWAPMSGNSHQMPIISIKMRYIASWQASSINKWLWLTAQEIISNIVAFFKILYYKLSNRNRQAMWISYSIWHRPWSQTDTFLMLQGQCLFTVAQIHAYCNFSVCRDTHRGCIEPITLSSRGLRECYWTSAPKAPGALTSSFLSLPATAL